MRARHDDDGFSLIEVSVVVTIIAVLIGLGLPMLIGSQKRSADTVARSSAAVAVRTVHATEDPTTGAGDVSTLNAEEKSVTFVDGATASGGPKEVSTAVAPSPGAPAGFVVAVQSTTGKCFFLLDRAGEPQRRAQVDLPATGCAAAAFDQLAPADWSPSLPH